MYEKSKSLILTFKQKYINMDACTDLVNESKGYIQNCS